MFKQPLEEMAEEDNSNGKNQALLNNTELKIIFGNLPPIYELHQWVVNFDYGFFYCSSRSNCLSYLFDKIKFRNMVIQTCLSYVQKSYT